MLGGLLARRKYGLIYGGGNMGLMGVVSTAALNAGGRVKGIIPQVFQAAGEGSQGSLEGSDDEIVPNMLVRKGKMIDLADAAIVLPGADGTLDELLDVVVAQQIKIYEDPGQPIQPLIVVNFKGYYEHFRKQREVMIEAGFLDERYKDFIVYVRDAQEAVEILDRANAAAPVPAKVFAPAKLFG